MSGSHRKPSHVRLSVRRSGCDCCSGSTVQTMLSWFPIRIDHFALSKSYNVRERTSSKPSQPGHYPFNYATLQRSRLPDSSMAGIGCTLTTEAASLTEWRKLQTKKHSKRSGLGLGRRCTSRAIPECAERPWS